jgi:hypothetical protein
VPFADSEELAKNSGAVLIEVGNDPRQAAMKAHQRGRVDGPGALSRSAGLFCTTLTHRPVK